MNSQRTTVDSFLILAFSAVAMDHYNECGRERIIVRIFADFRHISDVFGYRETNSLPSEFVVVHGVRSNHRKR